MTPNEYCQDKAAASGSSFYYSFRVLKPDVRAGITAFYALCRELDDVVDECSDPQVARLKLAWRRNEIVRLYAGHPEHPVTQALLPTIRTRNIPMAWLEGAGYTTHFKNSQRSLRKLTSLTSNRETPTSPALLSKKSGMSITTSRRDGERRRTLRGSRHFG